MRFAAVRAQMSSSDAGRSPRIGLLARIRAWFSVWTKVFIAEILCATCSDIL